MFGHYPESRDRPTDIIAFVGAQIQVLKIAAKCAFDVVISLVLLLLTAPLLCLTALVIFLEDGRPIFYPEERFGLNGRRFDVIKFRSMWVDAEKDGVLRWAAANDPRVTCVGSLIRKVRIDELPQLVNVLRGDMSFVGPPPERPPILNDLIKEVRMMHRGWPVDRKRLDARRSRLPHNNPEA
jgi:lipopolysaccharide/colanic/teichoic acid biosynthesis glycosyltransferase